MTTIEIFKRDDPGRVIEVKRFNSERDFEAFRFFWNRQCDDVTYGWRIKE